MKSGTVIEERGTWKSALAKVKSETGKFVSKPEVFLVFSTVDFDNSSLLRALKDAYPDTRIVGCTSGAAVFCDKGVADSSSACIMGIDFEGEMEFTSGLGEGLRDSFSEAVSRSLSGFKEMRKKTILTDKKNASVLVLADGMAGRGEDLVREVGKSASLAVSVFGGLAGDSMEFKKSYVFYEDGIFQDAVVTSSFFMSDNPGIGVKHGWEPISDMLEITEVEGNILKKVDGRKAIEVWKEVVEKHLGRSISYEELKKNLPLYEIGIPGPRGMVVRAPLTVNEQGDIVLATSLARRTYVYIVHSTGDKLLSAARESVEQALESRKKVPSLGMFFSCAARYSILKGQRKEYEIIKKSLPAGTPFIGFNTYGEIAKRKGEIRGFHNTTLVSVVF